VVLGDTGGWKTGQTYSVAERHVPNVERCGRLAAIYPRVFAMSGRDLMGYSNKAFRERLAIG
jgi:hypothetical protein